MKDALEKRTEVKTYFFLWTLRMGVAAYARSSVFSFFVSLVNQKET